MQNDSTQQNPEAATSGQALAPIPNAWQLTTNQYGALVNIIIPKAGTLNIQYTVSFAKGAAPIVKVDPSGGTLSPGHSYQLSVQAGNVISVKLANPTEDIIQLQYSM